MSQLGFRLCLSLVFALSLPACARKETAGPEKSAAESAAVPAADPVERGKYLVSVLGCNDCHTPYEMGPNGPEPDMKRMLSGHPQELQVPPPPKPVGPWVVSMVGTSTAFAGPWGITYATNLTPDQNTGMGIWTEEMFVGALRTGKHMGTSRPIQPLMPWQTYRNLTDEDLKAVFAYLRSIPPIVNRVPEYQPPKEAPAK
jgi:mono/diheme cytochrome c family protein